MQAKPTQRVAGLDMLRALAILLVLVAHYPKAGGGLLTRGLNLGWIGVDLFFVLSGYLIGGQLFKSQVEGDKMGLGRFYVRRLVRTLPSYYAVLAVYFLLPSAPGWKYAVFAQNFYNPTTFAPSWSLCVEEQFYLFFPLLVLLLRRASRLIWSIPVILGLEFAIRAATWFHVRPDLLTEPHALNAYMGYFYYPTTCRLDGIALGVGIAALKWFRPTLWWRLMARGNQLLCLSGGFLALALLALWKHYSFLCSTAGFTLLNLSFALLTVSVLSGTGLLSRIHVYGARQIAALSYSIYLTHTLALDLAGRLFGGFQSLPVMAAAVALILLFAAILHFAIERPSLAVRDRLLENNQTRRYVEIVHAGPLSSH